MQVIRPVSSARRGRRWGTEVLFLGRGGAWAMSAARLGLCSVQRRPSPLLALFVAGTLIGSAYASITGLPHSLERLCIHDAPSTLNPAPRAPPAGPSDPPAGGRTCRPACSWPAPAGSSSSSRPDTTRRWLGRRHRDNRCRRPLRPRPRQPRPRRHRFVHLRRLVHVLAPGDRRHHESVMTEAIEQFNCFGGRCAVLVAGAGPAGRPDEAAALVRRRLAALARAVLAL